MPKTAESARKRRFKDDVYAAAARLPAALANSHRLELLDLVAQRARTVQDVAAEAGVTVANASQHLKVLARCGLVSAERRGRFALYRAADTHVYRLLVELRSAAASADGPVALAERRYFGEREPGLADFRAVSRELNKPGTALLDVRPRAEYEAGHLPGAISAPIEVLEAGEIELQRSKHYLVYCRGPYCVFADEAVTVLRARGLQARRLAVGPVEWIAAGGDVRRAG